MPFLRHGPICETGPHQTNRHQGKRERTGQNSVQLPPQRFNRLGMSRISPQRPKVQRDGSCMAAFFSHRRYAEHIEIGKSPATPCQRQNPGKNACRLKSATISSPEGFCSISCLYEQSSPYRRKTWHFSLHRKIYFKQTTGRPDQLSEGFPQNRSFPFQKSGMKKGASFWMRPVQIMPSANYSWPLKSGVRIRNWSLISLPLLLGMKVS